MEYKVCKLDTIKDIEKANRFEINNFNWRCVYYPQCYGFMGYVDNVGLVVRIVTEEKTPKATYSNPQDPVYKDSAVEVFVAFQETQPTQSSLYMNFEINANGAMLANYGYGRKNRKKLSKAMYERCQVKANVYADYWSVDMYIPQNLIQTLTGIEKFMSDDCFYCNFYKIAEDEEIEHYASYSPIHNERPNFHLPEFFAKAIII